MKKIRNTAPEPAEGEICTICGNPITHGHKYIWSKTQDMRKRYVFAHMSCVKFRNNKSRP